MYHLTMIYLHKSNLYYGYSSKMGSSICQTKNVIFWTDVSMTETYKSPDGILKDMTKIIDRKVG